MYIEFSAQTIITAGAVLGAVSALTALAIKLVHWVDRQKEQDQELDDIREELTLLTYSILVCLRNLNEQGCDGPVAVAIDKTEKHLNKKAHDQGGN